MPGFWNTRRVVVTGGRGFLGSYVVRKLRDHGAEDVWAPSRTDYDLRDLSAVNKMYDDMRPNLLIHLAAVVGGIGANRERPGEFTVGTDAADHRGKVDEQIRPHVVVHLVHGAQVSEVVISA